MKVKNTHFPVIVAATHIKELNAVEMFENHIRVGASVTLTRLDQTLQQAISQLDGLCDMICEGYNWNKNREFWKREITEQYLQILITLFLNLYKPLITNCCCCCCCYCYYLYLGAVLAHKFWGALPHQPLRDRVHFLRAPKPEKYELLIGPHFYH